LELKEVHKKKRAWPSKEATKAMKTQMLDPYMRKDKRQKGSSSGCTYFESQAINTNVD
jgi:hypothetical protein